MFHYQLVLTQILWLFDDNNNLVCLVRHTVERKYKTCYTYSPIKVISGPKKYSLPHSGAYLLSIPL